MYEVLINGSLVTLSNAFSTGKEGALFYVPNEPQLVAKVFTSAGNGPKKVETLLKKKPSDSVGGGYARIAFPISAILKAKDRAICGYIMPRASGRGLDTLINASTRPSKGDYAFRLDVAFRLAWIFAHIHSNGLVIGDVRGPNILYDLSRIVTVIDTDSFQVQDASGQLLLCQVRDPFYTAPDLHGAKLTDVTRRADHDNWGLSTLIFQLLTGRHPFDAAHVGPGKRLSREERIRRGLWPYGNGSHQSYLPIHPEFLSLLHPGCVQLVRDCFADGHQDHARRPTAAAWKQALQDAASDRQFIAGASSLEQKIHHDLAESASKRLRGLKKQTGARTNRRSHTTSTSHVNHSASASRVKKWNNANVRLLWRVAVVMLVPVVIAIFLSFLAPALPQFMGPAPPSGKPTPDSWNNLLE